MTCGTLLENLLRRLYYLFVKLDTIHLIPKAVHRNEKGQELFLPLEG
jgi:hypothetical protein